MFSKNRKNLIHDPKTFTQRRFYAEQSDRAFKWMEPFGSAKSTETSKTDTLSSAFSNYLEIQQRILCQTKNLYCLDIPISEAFELRVASCELRVSTCLVRYHFPWQLPIIPRFLSELHINTFRTPSWREISSNTHNRHCGIMDHPLAHQDGFSCGWYCNLCLHQYGDQAYVNPGLLYVFQQSFTPYRVLISKICHSDTWPWDDGSRLYQRKIG